MRQITQWTEKRKKMAVACKADHACVTLLKDGPAGHGKISR